MTDRVPGQAAWPVRASGAPVAFLSYAHAESELALAFRDALRGCGLSIIIDVDHLTPQEDIAAFARRAVRAADATVCLVSTASLSSAWVVLEAITTLHKEEAVAAARFIACASDDTFMDPDLRMRLTRTIDEHLERNQARFLEHFKAKLDIRDLSLEHDRLTSMRANLGEIIARLRNSLTLTINRETMASLAARVADHIRATQGLKPSRQDPRDICARAAEVRRYVCDGQTDDAIDRMLDFVREFSDDPSHLRVAISLSYLLRKIGRVEEEKKLTLGAAEQEQDVIIKLLALIDTIELEPRLPMAS
jgi:hypothetical protein